MALLMLASLAAAACSGESERTSPPPVAAPAPAVATPPVNSSTAAEPTPAAKTGIHFTDVSATSGLDTTMTSGRLPSSQILEVKGGGLALFDADGDGDLDVFVPNGATLDDPERGPGARLFENITERAAPNASDAPNAPGAPNGGDAGGANSAPVAIQFRDVTATSGIAHTRWSFGVAAGDVDGDGREDLYVCCFGNDVLLRNITEPGGPIRFEDATAASGLGEDDAWSTGAAFGDLDRDGDLDLYVTRYLDFDPAAPPSPTLFNSIPVMAGPKGLAPEPDSLYENIGGGRFRDVSTSAGIRAPKGGYGLNAAILDLTGDGLPDIFVGNDSDEKFLFKNLGPAVAADAPADGGGEAGAAASSLRFEEIGMASGIATNIEGAAQATMGIAIADVDGNGRPDVFTTNFSSDTNTLHLNRDGRNFDDRTQQFGLGAVSRPFVGWACGFFDFDHDGDEDLLIVNGHVYPQATRKAMDSDYEQTPLLLERRGPRFERAWPESAGAWLGEAHRDRTAVFGDLDGDGDIDVIVGELNGPCRVLRNDTAGPWIIVDLDDASTPGNRRAVGAVIEVSTKDATQRRYIFGGGPFQSTIVNQGHFGFAPESVGGDGGTIEVVVTWPDGAKTTAAVELNRRTAIRRPE